MGQTSAPPVFDPSKLSEQARAFIEDRFREAIEQLVPHNRALGLEYVGIEGARLLVRLPYKHELIGNPTTGVIHGGAITSLMDATCGLAVFLKVFEPVPVATLDLRIDYLKPARPKSAVVARAECFKVTQSVAFARSETYHEDDEDDVVAVATGTFMVFRGKTFEHPGNAT